ncbi:MAG TPA: hypothetical protein VFF03_10375 [Rhodocyclaceae bacterium]|nr:hypothetical protein [Rhodocyclaceae bacterium]
MPKYLLLLLALAAPAVSASVACHYTYGGETKTLVAPPVDSPYPVETIAIGSFFRFRVVFQAAPADRPSVKVYTYAAKDDSPVLIHQATYAYPPARPTGPYGFTGLQSVYEPLRESELQYWCELRPEGRAAR